MPKYSIFMLIIAAILIVSLNAVLAQENNIEYNSVQVPPSPDAASLGKYGEYPIDLSTGLQSISVPIMDINEGGINLTISLGYHASGNKVNEEASSVGLGWSLAAGGAISRSVRSMPDDHHNGFLYNCDRVPLEDYVNNNLMDFSKRQEMLNVLNDIAYNRRDYEPDFFTYNLSTESGVFMFNNVGKPECFPYQDIIIDPYYDQSKISGFEVIDANGIVYFFGDTIYTNEFTETTLFTSGEQHQSEYISSWLLNYIYNPLTNSKIFFKYSYKMGFQTTLTESLIYENGSLFGPLYYPLPKNDVYTRITTKSLYLDRIIVGNQLIEFIKSTRFDNDGKKIDQIKFNNRIFKFNYSYFGTLPSAQKYLRLKLDSLVDSSLITSQSKKYSFFYNNSNFPGKDSKSVDHWGYYNGETNLTSIPWIPELDYVYENSSIFGNREPASDETNQIGILQKIIYPTGGETNFIYSTNTFAEFPLVDEVKFQGQSEIAYVSMTDYNIAYVHDTVYIHFDTAYNYLDFSIWASFQNSEYLPDPGGYIPPDFGNYYALVRLINLTTNEVEYQGYINKSNSDDINAELNNINIDNDYILIASLKRANGEFSANFQYNHYDPDSLEVLRDYNAGGLRIKQIINIDNITGRKEYRTYDYKLSGYLYCPLPVYYKQSKIVKSVDGNIIESYNRFLTYASPVGGIGSSPNSVSYESVKEYFGTPENNFGWKITSFDKYVDDPFESSFCPQVNFQSLRSYPIKEEIYDSQALLKNRIIYTYSDDLDHCSLIKAFRASVNYTMIGVAMQENDFLQIYDFGRYTYYLPKKQLTKINTFEYYDNKEMKTEVIYSYFSKNHLNPSKITTIYNDNNTKEEYFTYPGDYLPEMSCRDSYFEDVELCTNELNKCMLESFACANKFGAVYPDYLECVKECRKKYVKGINILGIRFRPVSLGNTTQCINDMNNSLSAPGGYYDCIDSMTCNYIPCLINAKFQYEQCLSEYLEEITNLSYNSTNVNEKAVHLLYFLHCNNVLIEDRVVTNGIINLNILKNFVVLNDSDRTIPVISEIIDMVNNNKLITYNKVDTFSNILQQTNNGKSPASYIWCYNNKYLIAEINNSTYFECGYTGFENQELNGWNKYQTNLFNQNVFFTGKASIEVTQGYGPGREFPVGLQANDHSGYQASVWVKGSKDAYLHIEANSFSIHQRMSNEEEGDAWHLLKVVLYKHQYESLIDSNLIIKVYVGNEGGDIAYFDDLRFYPLDAQMTTYTYEPLIGITSESDNNNKPIKYVYDAFGRLTLIRDFQGNILKKNEYHYKP